VTVLFSHILQKEDLVTGTINRGMTFYNTKTFVENPIEEFHSPKVGLPAVTFLWGVLPDWFPAVPPPISEHLPALDGARDPVSLWRGDTESLAASKQTSLAHINIEWSVPWQT
jgi:hypothetical protein